MKVGSSKYIRNTSDCFTFIHHYHDRRNNETRYRRRDETWPA